MPKTILNKWHDVDGVYTRDSWEIPVKGTEIWCTGWSKKYIIKPYGEGMHVYVGSEVYHNDQLMSMLDKRVTEGYTWGIDGVEMTREQQINGRWEKVVL